MLDGKSDLLCPGKLLHIAWNRGDSCDRVELERAMALEATRTIDFYSQPRRTPSSFAWLSVAGLVITSRYILARCRPYRRQVTYEDRVALE